MTTKPIARKRLDKTLLTEEVWKLTVIEGASFTAQSLAVRLKMTPNRHFRQHLNHLAAIGVLKVSRVFCDDGFYRKYFYSAQGQLSYISAEGWAA